MALVSIPLLVSVAVSLIGNHASYTCDSELDLRKAGMSMHGIPFLEQGDTNLCAPYTASEMIDAWRSKKLGRDLKPDERTSPMALGIEFAAKNDFPYSFPIQNSTDPLARKTPRWGGVVCVYANSAREIGVCSDRVLQETQGRSLEAIEKSEALFHALNDYLALDPKARDEKKGRFADRIYTVLAAFPPVTERAFLPTIEQINEELTFFTGDDPYVPMSRLLLASCRKHRTALPDLPNCRSIVDAGLDGFGWGLRTVPFREAETFRALKRLLARENPTPVAFTYCHKVIRAGHAYTPTSIVSPDCGSHWSLIIGSRSREGRCQLLVRDSDGGKPDRVSSDWEVDHGDVWADAETLMSATYMLEWFE